MVPVILGAGTMANSTPLVGLGSPPGRLLAATRVYPVSASTPSDRGAVGLQTFKSLRGTASCFGHGWLNRMPAPQKLRGMSKPCKTLK